MTRKFLIAAAALLVIGGSAAAAPKQQQMQGPAGIANPVRVTKASIEFKCGDTTYKLSTGNAKGICGVGATVAECTDSRGNSSRVQCDVGCKNTTGSGTCSTK